MPHILTTAWMGESATQLLYPRPMQLRLFLFALLFAATTARAQFDIEESHTTASLRGIHGIGAGVAWASGTNGTVLRSEDGGYLWQNCTIPPGAEKLDFRGIQGFDANTAIVMSSGPGDQSRLYKTTDGCQTWRLIFTNPDKDGFWDSIQFRDRSYGALLGDPVGDDMTLFETIDGGQTWKRNRSMPSKELAVVQKTLGEKAAPQPAFAASNSSLLIENDPTPSGRNLRPNLWIGVGGILGAQLIRAGLSCESSHEPKDPNCQNHLWVKYPVPITSGTASSGVFSLGSRIIGTQWDGWKTRLFVLVGGDYTKPNDEDGTAAYATTQQQKPSATAAQTPPHGYRSSVAYDAQQKLWITVGPNGTDISRDDGKNWTPLTPSGYDPPDADKNWNALSLPFVVGPHGRIGRLRPTTQK
jgi:hypothetical protein